MEDRINHFVEGEFGKTLANFKAMAEEAGVPYQNLINLYLRDCLAQSRKVQINWPKAA